MSRKSLRQPVDDMCKGCIYDPHSSGTWREQVAECTDVNCPLFSVRPLPINSRGAYNAVSVEFDPEFGLKGANLGIDSESVGVRNGN